MVDDTVTTDAGQRLCAICERRPASPVCAGCQAGLAADLTEIAALHRDLVGQILALDPDHAGPAGIDPIAQALPAGPVPAAATGPRVGGSSDPAGPLNLDALALLGHPWQWNPTTRAWVRRPDVVHDPGHDQTGHVGVGWILDRWIADWCDVRARREVGPAPPAPVVAQTAWLAARLDWACDHHPAVADFATELRTTLAALRTATGTTTQRPQRCDGVPCRRCDLLTLYRRPGEDRVECGHCGTLLTGAEYDSWVRLVAAAARQPSAGA